MVAIADEAANREGVPKNAGTNRTMRPDLFVYSVIIGLLPFLFGIIASEIAPHSDAAQLPWFTIVTLPLSVIIGLVLALFM